MDIEPQGGVPVIHNSPEWHATRAKHVGGSEIAALFDLPTSDRPAYMLTRYALWHVKAGNAPPPHVSGPRPVWGLRIEAAIADAAAEQEIWQIRKGGYVSDPTTPGLGCTLDFIIEQDPDEQGPGVLETKNVDWMVHRRSWVDGEPPLHILLQLQHQLAATGYSWGCVAGLIGGNDMRLYRYKARPKLIANIRRRVREFWASIAEGREPPVDGSDSASAVLRSLYPEVVDDAIDLSGSNEWPEAVAEFMAAGEARKEAAVAYDNAKNRVVALLGGHKRGYGSGYSVNTAVSHAIADRPARPGEIIKGRAETRRYTAKFQEIAA